MVTNAMMMVDDLVVHESVTPAELGELMRALIRRGYRLLDRVVDTVTRCLDADGRAVEAYRYHAYFVRQDDDALREPQWSH